LADIDTYTAQLVSVRAAILAIESGAQDYTIGGGRVTKADLATLYKRESELEGKIAGETYGTRGLAQWPGR
jgi:hypothetical protein